MYFAYSTKILEQMVSQRKGADPAIRETWA